MNNKLFVFLYICLFVMVIACSSNKKEKNDKTLKGTSNVALTATNLDSIHICSQLIPMTNDSLKGNSAGIIDSKRWRWESGVKRNLFIYFLDGNSTIQNKVLAAAKQWEPVANITLVQVDKPLKADIKISFQNSKGGSWSYIGKDSRNYDTTMNYGWLTATTVEKEINRVVLHEFGHALGLVHEHQNPNGNPIKWNKDLVLAYYTNNKIFTEDEVRSNIFDIEENIIGTNFDPKSIMLYAIPPEFTLDGYSTSWNYDLSSLDKSLINRIYRKR